MERQLDNLFLEIKTKVIYLMQEKNVDIDDLVFALGVTRQYFINNFLKRINDFSFYFETLHLLERW